MLKPISKQDKKVYPSNYRPISLLSLISKIIEKLVHDKVNEFLSNNKIIYKCQSGFIPNRSTNLSVSFLNDKIVKGFNEGLLTTTILIDLPKTFDTMNHQILLKKLEATGFWDQYIRWFQSYHCERIFFIEIESQLSDSRKIWCGAPQDSILGPLMFLIHVNDMRQAVKLNLFLYADDSCLMYQHRDVEELGK